MTKEERERQKEEVYIVVTVVLLRALAAEVSALQSAMPSPRACDDASFCIKRESFELSSERADVRGRMEREREREFGRRATGTGTEK